MQPLLKWPLALFKHRKLNTVTPFTKVLTRAIILAVTRLRVSLNGLRSLPCKSPSSLCLGLRAKLGAVWASGWYVSECHVPRPPAAAAGSVEG